MRPSPARVPASGGREGRDRNESHYRDRLLTRGDVPTLVPWLEQTLGFQIMPGDVYYVTDIPSEIELFDIAAIGIAAFVLTSLATLYPARRAAHVNPSMALRYE